MRETMAVLLALGVLVTHQAVSAPRACTAPASNASDEDESETGLPATFQRILWRSTR